MTPILQSAPIDVASWREDEEYFHYPEGARVKRALFLQGNNNPPYLRPERRYLFKRSRKAFPDQFWGEIVAYHVAAHLGVDAPPSFAAWDSRTGECGALIEWFYEDGKAAFIVGGSFLQQLIKDYDRERGSQHNFQSIRALSRAIHGQAGLTDWQLWWAKTFLFDALIGNTDRHQDNWGFLYVVDAGGILRASMAPCYDHGTSLGHERFPHLIAHWKEADYARYVAKGRHHMKWRLEDTDRPRMLEMVGHICELNPRVIAPLKGMIEQMDLGKIERSILHWQSFELPVPLHEARARLIMTLLNIRLLALRNALK